MKRFPQYSDFWFNRNTVDVDEFLGTAEKEKKGKDLIELSGYQRAISNFVNIVTGQNIPVKFSTRGDSYTDGKKVVISASLNDKSFDVAVGLALHEGSHIKLTDFDAYKNASDVLDNETIAAFEELGYTTGQVYELIKNLTNWVEDRRIDRFIFDTSPGYKGYYHSMYDKYFHSKAIDKALLSTEYRTEDVDSYMTRIINLTNSNRQLTALKGLKEIWEIVDLKNISRLKSTSDAIDVAHSITLIILKHIEPKKPIEDPSGQETPSEDATGDSSIDAPSAGNGSGDVATGDSDSPATESANATNDDGTEAEELSDRLKKQLENALKKQREFMNGRTPKGKLSKSDASTLNAIQQSGCTYKDVEMGEQYNRWGEKVPSKTKVVVVNNFTKSLIDAREFNCISWRYEENERAVNEGLRLGSILGRKLKVRSEETSTKYTRKDSGKMDQRLISELGFGNTNIFTQTFVDKYKDLNLHISIDASGSMSGTKWISAMTSAVAVIKAASMTSNINVQLTIRSTHSSGRNSALPLIIMAYDSRKDKMAKVKSLFPYMSPSGTTPESLTYDAIMEQFVEGSTNNDSYFLNYSDGAPMFNNADIHYYGSQAEKHTAKMIKKMNNKGIEVMSYFIRSRDGYTSDSEVKAFKNMYGKAAQFINPVSMMDVARTLNKKFLQKV